MTQDASKYGFFGLTNAKTTWMATTLPAPALNISAYYLSSRQPDFGWNWTDPRTDMEPFSIESVSGQPMSARNKTYTMDYILENGTCTPQNVYSWGFSAWQLSILLGLLFLWSLGVYLMWLKAHLTIKLRGGLKVPGPYQSALRFANAIHTEFVGEEKTANSLTEAEMRMLLSRYHGGGAVSMESSSSSGVTFSFRQGLWRWMKREWQWILAWLLSAGCFISLLFVGLLMPLETIYKEFRTVNFFVIWSMCAPISISLAMLIGRETRTRVFYVGFGMALSLVVILPITLRSIPHYRLSKYLFNIF